MALGLRTPCSFYSATVACADARHHSALQHTVLLFKKKFIDFNIVHIQKPQVDASDQSKIVILKLPVLLDDRVPKSEKISLFSRIKIDNTVSLLK